MTAEQVVPCDRLRILHVVTQREPAGAQRVAHDLCRGMRARGHDSDVWFLYRKSGGYDAHGYRDFAPRRPHPATMPLLCWRLASAMRDWSPDVVIAHTHHANTIGSIAAFLARVPRRIVVHHSVAQHESRVRRMTMDALRRATIFDGEVFVSDTTRRSYGPSAASRGALIHNGVRSDAGSMDRHQATGRWRASGRPLVVSVGRLSGEKNHALLIDAMRLVDADLAIVGEGPLRHDLTAQIERADLVDRVTLVGNIEPAEVDAALSAADVVALPSVFETVGMVALEAAAVGASLVVSDIPAHREILDDAAVYHPVDDATMLARQIVDLLGDVEHRAELGRRAQRRARRFDLDGMVESYLELLGC